MKKRGLLILFAVISVCFVGGCEVESSASFNPSYEDTVMLANSIFKKLDKNGDGFLSQKEFSDIKHRKWMNEHKKFAEKIHSIHNK